MSVAHLSRAKSKIAVSSILSRFLRDVKEHGKKDLTEQDLQRNYILPVLTALGWDIYDLNVIRQEKFRGVIKPDILIVDRAGKRICVEVKPAYKPLSPEEDIGHYTKEKVRNWALRTVWLTSFQDSYLCVFADSGRRVYENQIRLDEDLVGFDDLWKYLSNTEESVRSRAAEKANATSNR